MNIYGKSAADVDQLINKKNRGFDRFELQLLDEMISNKGILNAEDVYDLPALTQFNIYAVHAPLLTKGDVNLEHVVRGPKVKLLDQCFYIAEYLAKARMRDITLVIHTGTSVEELQQLGDMWNDLCVTVGLMLDKYPHVHLAIENVTPFIDVKHHNIRFTNNCKFDNVEMAQKLREIFETDRIGTVLDTCHAMMTQRYIQYIYDLIDDKELYPMENLSLDEFFKQNAEVCKLIHLSGLKGNGIKAPDHGAPFLSDNPNDIAQLKHIMNCYIKYGYGCPIILEIGEVNVNNPINYLRTYQTLLSLYD